MYEHILNTDHIIQPAVYWLRKLTGSNVLCLCSSTYRDGLTTQFPTLYKPSLNRFG